MPFQDITTTIAQPAERVDFDAVKLAAKKVVVPGATDTHGCQVTSVAGVPGGTSVTIRVVT